MDLESAYKTDVENREREKAVVINELEDTREYVRVLNEEIENGKKRAEALKQELYSRDREAEEMKQRLKKKNVAIIVAFVELVLIALLGVLLIKAEKDTNTVTADPEENNVTQQQDAVTNGVIKTKKIADDLQERIVRLPADDILPFYASLTERNGFEYLTFTYGEFRILYRNGYPETDATPQYEVIIENGRRALSIFRKYDLSADFKTLCPKMGKYLDNGREQFLFVGEKKNSIPETLEFIDTDMLWSYKALDVSEALLATIETGYTTERPADIPASAETVPNQPFMVITGGAVSYNFLISENQYTSAAYNDEMLVGIADESSCKISESSDGGIVFTAVLKMEDGRYIGEITGTVGLADGTVSLKNVKHGVFAYADQEDPARSRVIEPYPSYISQDDRVTILGYAGERFILEKYKKAAKCEYNWENLNTEDANNFYLTDDDGNVITHMGIDVSKYQAAVNWEKVKKAGAEFAIIRLGYRGMNEGTLELDPYYVRNIEGANSQDIKAGVYFFSQALTEEEAREEAAFVIENIKKYKITYPVVYDTERVTTYNARANKLSREQRTNNAIAFCEEIRKAGYIPMIYANTKYMTMGIDLDRLTDIDMWFAFYGTNVSFPYDFKIWQYTESGKIDGVPSAVDINISFIDY